MHRYAGARNPDSLGRAVLPDYSDQAGLRGAQLLGAAANFPQGIAQPSPMPRAPVHGPLLANLAQTPPGFNLNPVNMASSLPAGSQIPNLAASSQAPWMGTGPARHLNITRPELPNLAMGLSNGSGASVALANPGGQSTGLGGMSASLQGLGGVSAGLQQAQGLPPVRTQVSSAAPGNYSLFKGSRLPLDHGLGLSASSTPGAVSGPFSSVSSGLVLGLARDTSPETLPGSAPARVDQACPAVLLLLALPFLPLLLSCPLCRSLSTSMPPDTLTMAKGYKHPD